MSEENRSKFWDKYINQGGYYHGIVKHMFLHYDRYHEAGLIERSLVLHHANLTEMSVLDYGCGVGDYGIHLLRAGAEQVHFYDFPRATDFVWYRLMQEDLPNGVVVNADLTKIDSFKKYDLVIFGEVLEHLDDPLSVIKACVKDGVKFIFTSSYPYRSDDPEDPYWNNHDHDEKARLQMPQCRKLLEDSYSYTKFDGELRLWAIK